ncbi:low molecular weight protein-tyrosine-phosphatase [Novosphingobium colocasiae]|uniref:protein-tyrosine-phosphatase n=1 Tax=Novosphingobium colocasiae TaxID=1256513 RepID=A0A918PDU2_9SPHN|nr:low molecular weight protein-tyrosine-phosphatase [Novosphingobium colocasiae]GGZ01943.1 phosphotyrosine protein phosphatase [Novosphingobium colocasiae]
MQSSPVLSVLFVCLGNICRSPLAEAALRETAGAAGLSLLVDSAGTGSWHIGHPPDPRARAEAARHGIDIGSYRARQVTPDDFLRFDRIYALDRSNLSDLQKLAPAGATAQVALLLDAVPALAGQSVADPYHGDAAHFAQTWQEVTLAARHIVDVLRQP